MGNSLFVATFVPLLCGSCFEKGLYYGTALREIENGLTTSLEAPSKVSSAVLWIDGQCLSNKCKLHAKQVII